MTSLSSNSKIEKELDTANKYQGVMSPKPPMAMFVLREQD